MPLLELSKADSIRRKLTAEEYTKIRKLYENAAKQAAKKAEGLKGSDNISATYRIGYLMELRRQLNAVLDEIEKELNISIPSAMRKAASAVAGETEGWLAEMGLSVEGAFSNVPDDIVKSVITGQVYKSDWNLSRALWRNTKKAQSDIDTIIANGIAQNLSSYDIAKDLAKYVNPKAKKDWEWSKIYPGTTKKIEYNAFRLASTMVSHAYQQSFEMVNEMNPFVTGYKWLTSNSHRETCEVCRERASQNKYGLGKGVYPKGKLPLDHPNGLCTFAVVVPDSDKIVDDIAAWYKGAKNPKLDRFAASLKK